LGDNLNPPKKKKLKAFLWRKISQRDSFGGGNKKNLGELYFNKFFVKIIEER